MPFKIRTKLITAFLGIIFPFLLIVGIIYIYNLSIIYKGIHKIERTTEQRAVVTDLRFAIEGALMPGNDYIITGDRKYIDDFQKESKGVEDRIKHVEEILAHPPIYKATEKMGMLKDTKNAWHNIKECSLKIFEISDPVGNRDASRLMEEMDYNWGYPAIERLSRWREIDLEEYREAHEMSEKAWRQAYIIMVAGSIILVALGVSFALFYSKIFVKPIYAIHNGADAISAGNFKTRLDIKTGDEIEQLADAMNEMAEKLDDFYGNLENQVMERTRELEESEERFRQLFQGGNDAIFVHPIMPDGRPGKFIEVNNLACERLGFTKDEFLNMSPLDIDATDMSGSREAILKEFAEKKHAIFEMAHMTKDGRRIPVEINAHIFDLSGTPMVLSIARDITDRKKAEDAIRENEKRLKTITETAPNAIICMRSPGAVTLWNRSAERIFGYTSDEVIGRNLHDIIVPERYKEKSREGLKGFFETGTGPVVGKTIEIFALRKDGSEFPVELSISAMRIKDEWQTAAIVRDITERKEAEAAIKKERDYSKSLLETAQAIILTLDTEGRIVSVNRYMEELSGYKLDEVKGKDWFTTFLPECDHDRIRSLFKEAISGISTKGNVNPILTSDGREVVVEWYANSLKDLDGRTIGLLAIGQDITERKVADEKLKRNLEDIKRMNKLMVDREIRMIELKKENQRLRDEAGKKVEG